MKIGDKVRFLSDVGGGIIAGIQSGNIVLVEDEDGFQIPTAMTDVVVVGGDENYDTAKMVDGDKRKKTIQIDEEEDYDPADRPVTFKAPVEERRGGDMLSAYIAFVPVDITSLMSTRFEAYFVNDSNYYMRYHLFTVDGANWCLRSAGEVEPNTKLFMEEFGREQLNDWERICIQINSYKRNKSFMLKPVVDLQLRVDTVKFYKLHTFQENDFFEQSALIYTLIENDRQERTLVLDPDKFKKELMSKVATDSAKIVSGNKKDKLEEKNSPVVIDLHANELLDTTKGMSAVDILNYQLDTFRKTLAEYAKQKGRKIVFIHGKGEGVLRHAIINELRYRFKNYPYQDASFREYGYGATLVTIK